MKAHDPYTGIALLLIGLLVAVHIAAAALYVAFRR